MHTDRNLTHKICTPPPRTRLLPSVLTVLALLMVPHLAAAAPPHGVAGASKLSSDDPRERSRRIEESFAPVSLAPGEPPVKLTLQQLMRISNVSEMSIAVIDGYRIDWAKGYGQSDQGEPVTPETLFPACSISKPISALAALRLVEEGRLSLDDDGNRILRSWKVPENEFTREQKVTLRRLLTHTAGTTDHGFSGYALGEPSPTLRQVLDGEPPATTQPVRVTCVPGTRQSYSGGGFVILQQLMIDATGESFPDIVRRRVFAPLTLTHSVYGPPGRPWRAATGRDRDGEPVPTRSGPEFAVGGLWTTPSDLARIAIEVAQSRHGRSNRVLSTAMTREMLRVQVNPRIEGAPAGGPETQTGLGWFLGEESDPARFEHTGVNIGFAAKLLMWDSGHGVVVMANNWAFETECLMRYVINAVAREYGWSYRVPTYTPWPYANTVLLASARLRGVSAAIAEYHELKKLWAEQQTKVGDLTTVWASDPPDYPPTGWDLLGLAQAIGDPRHLDDAIDVMKAEMQEYPRFEPAYPYLADLYVRSGRRDLAIQTYQALLRLDPSDPAAANALKELRDPAAKR